MRDMRQNRVKPQRNKNRQKRERKPRKPIQFRRILRKSARICVGFIAVTLCWTLCSELYGLVARATPFKLERIEMSRLQHMDRAGIISQAGIKLGDSLLQMDLQHIAEQIERNPWVETLKLRRRFPSTLSVEIVERKPVAVVNMGYLYYLDAKGTIFKPVTEGDRLDFPIITGLTREDLERDPAGSKAMVQTALGIVDLLKKGTLFRLEDISEIHLDKGYGYTLFTAQSGIPLKLGNNDFPQKLARLSRIYRDLATNLAALDYVDLNYSDKIIVKKV